MLRVLCVITHHRWRRQQRNRQLLALRIVMVMNCRGPWLVDYRKNGLKSQQQPLESLEGRELGRRPLVVSRLANGLDGAAATV